MEPERQEAEDESHYDARYSRSIEYVPVVLAEVPEAY